MCVNILCLVRPQSLGSGQHFCPETRKGGLVVDPGDGVYEDITETAGKSGTPSHARLLTTFSRSLKSQRACAIHSGHKYLSSVHCVFQAPTSWCETRSGSSLSPSLGIGMTEMFKSWTQHLLAS